MRRRLKVLLPADRTLPVPSSDEATKALAHAWGVHLGEWLELISDGQRVGRSRVVAVGREGVRIEAELNEGADLLPEDISLVTPALPPGPLATRLVSDETPIVEGDEPIP
jgi:hypothetical protein